MSFFTRLTPAGRLATGVLTLGLVATGAQAQESVAPAVSRLAQNLGQQSPSTPVSATVWLNLHDRAALDARIKALYETDSPSFHKWLSSEDLQKYAPTAAEVEKVKKELASHNLSIVSVDEANLSIKIKGQTSDFERAFSTQVNRYMLKGRVVQATTSVPKLSGDAATLVHSVSGVGTNGLQPMHVVPKDIKTGKQMGLRPVKSSTKTALASPAGIIYSSQCFYAPTTASFKGSTTSASTTGTFHGLSYGANPNNTLDGTVGPCGYAPTDVYRFYGLNTAYGLGYTGKGQTVVIVDAFGSPTITADAAAFNSTYHLPAFTSSNFKIYKPSPVTMSDAGWAGETTLDVEWAHAIAPGAKIALIATPTNNDDDLQAGVLYAIRNKLGNVISNSYGEPETMSDPQTMEIWDLIAELGAAQGISVNFATGDEGDYSADVGESDVSTPADSPYATAIGGTSVATSADGDSIFQSGWGTNATILALNNKVANPPMIDGFQFGAGGGRSAMFAKPSYQSKLPGAGRHLPDISAIADPFTGVEIILTVDGEQFFEVIGGTSLATPVFSGMWAILNQYAGEKLGQAAPYIAKAPAEFLTDIVPTSPEQNVSGSITTGKKKTTYTDIELSEPLHTTKNFTSALWNAGEGEFVNLTFGTDSSLTVTQGWDNVTGYGTPDLGALFSKAQPAK